MNDPEAGLLARPKAALWADDLPGLSADQISELRSHFPNLRADKQDEFNFRVRQLFQAAYRSETLLRSPPKNKKLSTKRAEDIGAISEKIEALIGAIDGASNPATDLLDDLLTPFAAKSGDRQPDSIRGWRDLLAPFDDKVAHAAQVAADRVKRGRSEAGLRQMVSALYALREDLNGTPSKRNYRPGELSVDGRGAESGPFLDLVRAFARMVNEALPQELQRSKSPSLSKVVREETKPLKKPMAKQN